MENIIKYITEAVITSGDRITFVTLFNQKYKRIVKHASFCLATIFLINVWSCKKMAETPIPTDQVAENAVYTNDATAISVLTAMYSSMNSDPFQGSNGSISMFAGLSADEYTLAPGITNSVYLGYFENALSQTSTSVSGGEHWAPLYNFIFRCNAAIAGLTASSSLTPLVKKQLLGEAEFIRAFSYFYLINEFGDVPLVLTTDPKTNISLARTQKATVYQQIIADLLDAKDKLSTDYLNGTFTSTTIERVRPTKWAAEALLSRVYLYTQEYTKAEEIATDIISNANLFSLESLNNVFLKNSNEAIWQIQPTDIDLNTQEGRTLIIPTTGPSSGDVTNNPVYINKQLLNSFEIGDQRAELGNWINRTIYQINTGPIIWDTVYYPYKYKISSSIGVTTADGLTEYFMVLRLAEQYLIRAEARANLGKTGEAQTDLNAIRNRAGLSNYSGSTDQASLLTAILNERRHELFSEWGHRWFDLKRTSNIDPVMTIVTPSKSTGIQWQHFQQLYPIPLEAIKGSPNLTQNSGY